MGHPLVEIGVSVAVVITTVLALAQRRKVYGGVRLSFDPRLVMERRRLSRARWWDRQVRVSYLIVLRRAEFRAWRESSKFAARRDVAIARATRQISSGPGEVVGTYGSVIVREHEVEINRGTMRLTNARASVAEHPKGWEMRIGPEFGPFLAAVFPDRNAAELAAEAVNTQAYDHDRYRTDHPRLVHTAQVMAIEALDHSDLEWAEARLDLAKETGHLAVERVVARTERALARDAYVEALRQHAIEPEAGFIRATR